VRFEKDRKKNRTLAKIDTDLVDSELLEYDVLNRSTNDQGSLQGRFDILLRRFTEFLDMPNKRNEWANYP
jgi:hypothetical protein